MANVMLLNKIGVFNWVTNSGAPRGHKGGVKELWVGKPQGSAGRGQPGRRASCHPDGGPVVSISFSPNTGIQIF